MTAPEQHWVVRVRIPRANAWPSRPMTRAQAVRAMEEFASRCAAAGDRGDFVEFDAFGGRVVQLRAREVLSVEVDQWKPRAAESEATAATGGPLTVAVHPGVPDEDEGTAFLRRQAHARAAGRR